MSDLASWDRQISAKYGVLGKYAKGEAIYTAIFRRETDSSCRECRLGRKGEMLGLGGEGDTALIWPIRRGNSKSHAVDIAVCSCKSVIFMIRDSPAPCKSICKGIDLHGLAIFVKSPIPLGDASSLAGFNALDASQKRLNQAVSPPMVHWKYST